jgi:hypothetical protein
MDLYAVRSREKTGRAARSGGRLAETLHGNDKNQQHRKKDM